MALPTATFDPTKVVVGRQSIVAFTPTGGSATNLLVDYVGHMPGLKIGSYQAPGASNGPAFTADHWIQSTNEQFKFKCKELKKIVTAFGSLAVFKKGAAIVYVRDPDDTGGAVAFLSESFACCLYRDTSEATFDGANPAEITLILESHKDGLVTLTPDGTP